VYVELPGVGDEVTAGSVCGEVESTKSVSELFSPVTGTVAEVNEAAVDDPALVNSDPYGAGWLLRVTVTGTGPLLSAEEYRRQVEA
jgi:glycine cleavage system H protein